jgi:hypothetical protein
MALTALVSRLSGEAVTEAKRRDSTDEGAINMIPLLPSVLS